MTTNRLTCCALWMLSALLVPRAGLHAATPIEAAVVGRLVQPLVDDGWVRSVVVGIVNQQGAVTLGFGRVSDTDLRPPDGDTVFELGSMTKVFTGLLLAQMVQAGDVRLDMPIQAFLPSSVPKHEAREITLLDLATHSSGLPRMPTNFAPGDLQNPYASYGVSRLYQFLSGHELSRTPGKTYEYSNLGMGLLGHALALKGGRSYEDLVVSEICRPLAMTSTRIALDDSMRRRLAPPHDADGLVVKNWDFNVLAGAGGFRSSANDMLKFVAGNLSLTRSSLQPAMQMAQRVQFDCHDGLTGHGLGWNIGSHGPAKERILWHNGQTGGYHSFLGILPKSRAGIVVLANTGTTRVDELGRRLVELLVGTEPEPMRLPVTAKIDPDVFDALSGKYSLADGLTLAVRRRNDALVARMQGQRTVRLWPESETKYFCRTVDAWFLFQRDVGGKVTGLTLCQSGKTAAAKRNN